MADAQLRHMDALRRQQQSAMLDRTRMRDERRDRNGRSLEMWL